MGHAHHAGLCRRIGGLAGIGDIGAGHRGDVDDTAIAVGIHVRQIDAGGEEGRLEADGNAAIPVRLLQIDEFPLQRGLRDTAHAGIVDENGSRPRRLPQRLNSGLVGEVADMAGGDKTGCSQFPGTGEDALAGRDEVDLETLFCQAFRTGEADAVGGTGAGDDRGLALLHRPLLSSRP